MIQHSLEWFEVRLGKITASKVKDILLGKRGKYLAARDTYMDELLEEILTGETGTFFETEDMKWGTATEPMARAYYEFITGRTVEEVGFIIHPEIGCLGASPDGVMSDRGLEIKCPKSSTHRKLLLSGKVNQGHIVQMQVGMMCTGLKKWDYVNFDPRLEGDNKFFLKTFIYDEALAKQIEMEVIKFKKELDEMVEKLK